MVLVDTSTWIEVFRRPSRLDIESVVDFDEIVTCLPVVQEVLQGFTTDDDFRKARGLLDFAGSGAWEGDLAVVREDRPAYGKGRQRGSR